jgi:hypothetical protein
MARRRNIHSMHGRDDIPQVPAEHWKHLRRGDRVQVNLAPGFTASGMVDAVTNDHSVVWVDLDGGLGRTLVHCGDGVEIVPQEA